MNRREFLAAVPLCGIAMGALPAWSAPLNKFKLGVIADEVTYDLEKALLWLKKYGLNWVELREIWEKRKFVTEFKSDEVKRVRDLLAQHGVKVSVLDSAYLKVTLPGTVRKAAERDQFQQDEIGYQQQDALLERAMARAKDFGTDKVRIFAFWRVADPKAIFDHVARELEKAAKMAASAGIRLVLENEHSTNVGTGAEAAAMLKAVNHPNLALNWDPGNAFAAGETPFPDGYSHLDKKRIWHMHIKDAQKDPKMGKNVWRPVGGGKIDYLGQFRALLKDGYTGTLSLETHYVHPTKDKVLASTESMDGLLDVLKRA